MPAGKGLPTLQILRPDGTFDPKEEPDVGEKLLLRMLRTMVTVRRLDTKMMLLQRQGRIGFYGTATGEEAAVVGSIAAFRDSDWVFPALRQGATLLWRGWSLAKWLANLFGSDEDVSRGRSMPCHYSDATKNVVTWSSCMSTQLPHAVGMAMAARYRKRDDVAAAYLGDGATSEGDFHAAMNFAGVYKAPCVFICHNNQWAISVPLRMQTASETIAQKAVAYGFPGVRVDGNDVLAVHRATKECVDRARAGGGPSLVEAVTYRMLGHSSSDDPTRYRAEQEVALWQKKDPLVRFRAYLETKKALREGEFEALEKEIDAEIERAIAHAEKAAPPARRSLVEEVYADVPWHLREQYRDAFGDDA